MSLPNLTTPNTQLWTTISSDLPVNFTGMEFSGDNQSVLNNATQRLSESNKNSRIGEKIWVGSLLALSVYAFAVTGIYLWTQINKNLCLTNSLCFLSSLLLLLRASWFHIEVYGLATTHAMCVVYALTDIVTGNASRILISAVLWIRQNLFNTSPLVAPLSSPRLKFLSHCTLVGVIIAPVVQTGLLLSLSFTSTTETCVLEKEATQFIRVTLPAVYLVGAVCQISLLALVLHPVAKHMRKKNSRRADQLESVTIRLSVVTIMYVTSDAAFIVLSINKPPHFSFSFVPILSGFNTLVNVIGLLFAFADWRRRFAPCNHVITYSQSLSPVTFSSRKICTTVL